MIRYGLATMIGEELDFSFVGEAGNGHDAVQLIPRVCPDIVLMDLIMPTMDGVMAMKALRASLPSTRFIILTSVVEPRDVKSAIEAGASGYLLKNASSQELVTAIRSVHSGRRVLAPEVTDAMVAAAQRPTTGEDLTQREREILALMTRGLNNLEISTELSIAMPTVKFHITNILSKLQVDNRTEAVLKALKFKLVTSDLRP